MVRIHVPQPFYEAMAQLGPRRSPVTGDFAGSNPASFAISMVFVVYRCARWTVNPAELGLTPTNHPILSGCGVSGLRAPLKTERNLFDSD